MNKKIIFIVLFSFVTIVSANSFEYPYYQNSKEPHELQFLFSGPEALLMRLDLIRSARKSVEMEYFSIGSDTAGLLLLQEAISAARRGVQVKILVDHMATMFLLNKYIARELTENRVQIKIYNNDLIHPVNLQFRNHRKLMVIDEKYAIVGGRNIGDKYFWLSSKSNRADRDVLVQGEVVGAMRDSFYAFWISPYVTNKPIAGKIGRIFNPVAIYRSLKAKSDLTRDDNDFRIIRDIQNFVNANKDESLVQTCNDVTYVSDRPGVGVKAFSDKYRYVRRAVFEKMRAAERRVYIETPFIVFDERKYQVMDEVLANGVDLSFKTNSLHATGVLPVITTFYDQIKRWLDRGVVTYLFKGVGVEDEGYLYEDQDTKWSIHSKTMLFDDEFMIGSVNFDPRSTVWNTELAFFCHSPIGAQIVESNIGLRQNYAHKITSEEELLLYGLKGAGLMRRLLAAAVRVPARWIKFLL